MFIQQDLKHSETIKYIIKKLQPIVHSLRYANKILLPKTLTDQYFTHVYPYLIGNISIWGTDNQNKTYIQPLIRLHKRIIRLICKANHRTHTAPLMCRLKILSITNLYILRTTSEMHPFIHNKAQHNRPDHIHQYIQTSDIHSYPTRYSGRKKNHIPSNSRKQRNKMNPFAREYSRVWNELPDFLREIEDLDLFKRRLKIHLLAKQSGFQIPDHLLRHS